MLRYRLRETERKPFPCPETMNPTLHALLVQRGIGSEAEAQRFLNPAPEHLHDPFLLSDMHAAVSRIREALECCEPICVYGDYDVDGVSASSLLADYLRSIGAEVEVYLPSRHTEGYGLNEAAIRSVAERNKILITVDCGVTSVELIELAKSLGMSCIVTDHHQPAAQLPDCPVLNPLLNGYPFPSLCGAGVAFKLVQALGGVEAAMKYVDIAALATVADVVPLKDENRVIVKLGLDVINKNPRPGVRALIEASGMTDKKITAGNIAFQLAPRLNAGGRIGSARRSHDLLLSPSLNDARPLADELEEENRARKEIEQQILADAEKQLEGFDFPAHRALVIAGKGWNHGVIGLAASRIVEKYHYPTIVLAEHDGVLTGSCRSIPGVDIHAALTAVSKHLTKFGGHKQAAGLTLDADRLDAFRADLDAWLMENIPPACYIPDEEYDMIVHLAQLSEGFVASLEALQPTGFGNPAPVLRVVAEALDKHPVGADGAHLRFMLLESRGNFSCIYFRGGPLKDRLPDKLDVLYTPKLNTYMGRTSVQLEIKTVRPADVDNQIAAKIEIEDAIQHEFLTEMLYNIRIKSQPLHAHPLTEDQLRDMLAQNPQGTLILTADLQQARRIIDRAGDNPPDLFIWDKPDDVRAFNAVCAYAPHELPKGYRRIVLAGAPDWYEYPEGVELYRMDAESSCRSVMPDVEVLRESYKGFMRVTSMRRWDEFYMLVHLLESYGKMHYATATACVFALNDLKLIEVDFDTRPVGLKIPPVKKVDPDSSAIWRAIQAWRTGCEFETAR